jgi:DNA-binding response OmpR family regulator
VVIDFLGCRIAGTRAKTTVMSRILVFDNDRAMRELLSMAIGQAGFTAVPVGEVADAEYQLAECGVDALLLDLHLGGGHSGVSLVTQWRERGWTHPFLIITGTPEHPSLSQLDGLVGFHGVLPKPFPIVELIDRVRALVAE